MFIDGNGDAEGNFTVVALLDDQDINGTVGMSMQPVGYFHYMPNGSNLPFALPVSIYNNSEPGLLTITVVVAIFCS